MTCPTPAYCNENGCSNNGCWSLPAAYRYFWRSRRLGEPGAWGGAVIFADTGAIAETYPTVREAMLRSVEMNGTHMPAPGSAPLPPRGWLRPYVAGGCVLLALVALIVAYAALLPW